jgi:hypothetical protein
MTALRLISFPAHALLELAIGLAVMVAPFVFGFEPAALVSGVAVGAIIVGLALSAAPGEGGTLRIGAHFAFDRGVAFGLLAAAALLGLAGDSAAALFFAVAAASQTALNLVTRYSAP